MSLEYVNRKDDTYYLHRGRTKTGKPKYYFSRKKSGELCDVLPDGFEVYENPQAQVFCRRRQTRLITDLEIEVVQEGLRASGNAEIALVDVKGCDIIIWSSNARELAVAFAQIDTRPHPTLADYAPYASYQQAFKFALVNPEERIFAPFRWCFRGSIDDWFPLSGTLAALPDLVRRYTPYIDQESFFELF